MGQGSDLESPQHVRRRSTPSRRNTSAGGARPPPLPSPALPTFLAIALSLSTSPNFQP
jgi:hypothetical protein